MPTLKQKRIVINTLHTEYPLLDEVVTQELGWRVSKDPDYAQSNWDVWWSDLGVDNVFLSQMRPYQKVNHYPAMHHIARKTQLAKNLKRLHKIYPNEFEFIPRSWTLPQEMSELRLYQEQRYKALDPQNKKKKSVQRMPVGFPMIVKPDQMS